MPCSQKKRETIMPVKTLDVIFRRRYVPNTQHYFTDRKYANANTAREFLQRGNHFKGPKSSKLLSYIKYSDRKVKVTARERSSLPLHLKGSSKIAAMRDLTQRLFIKEPPDEVKAIVEVDPEFYSVIEGRPLRKFDDITLYMNKIRSYAMIRQQIGYREDLVLSISKSITEEKDSYEKLCQQYKKQVKHFQRFLTDDYRKSTMIVAHSEKIHQLLLDKEIEYISYVSKTTILRNILFKLDAIRGILKTYRSFLMFIAPLPWRRQNDEILMAHDRNTSLKYDSGHFETIELDELDIDNIIERATAELKDPPKNIIYFNDPQEVMNIFSNIQLQSREYLMMLCTTDGLHHQLQSNIKILKQELEDKIVMFQHYINDKNELLSEQEEMEQFLQLKFFRILYGFFYDTVASPETLKLKLCIEFVYEQVFKKCEEGHQSLRDTMKVLELLYEDYCLRLDSLDFKTVKKAQAELYAQDLKLMRKAYKAERELKAFREMTNALNKAFQPPDKYKQPEYKNLTHMKPALAPVSNEADRKKSSNLTAVERENLILFTEWCEGMDPEPYLEQYNMYVKPTFEKLSEEKSYL
ncbi:hypothetical protein JYU34_021299 [Plutella xylostella]|uniref:Uncharacterized protein n=1 Tax=Plutella xylostella TaxID=51655 RepID=A0ABQ7PT90_PLUXY|nr:hypothetical protein JYU34_021299 [Plutella xylostella]